MNPTKIHTCKTKQNGSSTIDKICAVTTSACSSEQAYKDCKMTIKQNWIGVKINKLFTWFLEHWAQLLAELYTRLNIKQWSYSIRLLSAVKLQMMCTQTAASSCQGHVNQREVQISVTLLNGFYEPLISFITVSACEMSTLVNSYLLLNYFESYCIISLNIPWPCFKCYTAYKPMKTLYTIYYHGWHAYSTHSA